MCGEYQHGDVEQPVCGECQCTNPCENLVEDKTTVCGPDGEPLLCEFPPDMMKVVRIPIDRTSLSDA